VFGVKETRLTQGSGKGKQQENGVKTGKRRIKQNTFAFEPAIV
jgi:hypothetical protein